jgi:hydroxymethylpyrimidine pyrophosphatase-like HAD family hydrolase
MTPVKALVADVDGTLVPQAMLLTERAVDAPRSARSWQRRS